MRIRDRDGDKGRNYGIARAGKIIRNTVKNAKARQQVQLILPAGPQAPQSNGISR